MFGKRQQDKRIAWCCSANYGQRPFALMRKPSYDKTKVLRLSRPGGLGLLIWLSMLAHIPKCKGRPPDTERSSLYLLNFILHLGCSWILNGSIYLLIDSTDVYIGLSKCQPFSVRCRSFQLSGLCRRLVDCRGCGRAGPAMEETTWNRNHTMLPTLDETRQIVEIKSNYLEFWSSSSSFFVSYTMSGWVFHGFSLVSCKVFRSCCPSGTYEIPQLLPARERGDPCFEAGVLGAESWLVLSRELFERKPFLGKTVSVDYWLVFVERLQRTNQLGQLGYVTGLSCVRSIWSKQA